MDISKNIVYEDKGIIIVYKPAGVPVQTKLITVMDLESQVKNYLAKKTKSNPYLGMIHRIDQPVEGLVLFAKNEKMAAELSKEINNGEIEKYYMAVVCGRPQKENDKLVDYLLKDMKTNLSIISNKENKKAKKSTLEYSVIGESKKQGPCENCKNAGLCEGATLLDIRLFTGRHHQIRVQLSNAGFPIAGDRKYNKLPENEVTHFPALCAYRLKFKNPSTGEQLDVKHVPQGDFYNFFDLEQYFD